MIPLLWNNIMFLRVRIPVTNMAKQPEKSWIRMSQISSMADLSDMGVKPPAPVGEAA